MSIGGALYTLLSGESTVTDEVSDRIYPFTIPQETPNPCLKFEYDKKPTHDFDTSAGFDVCDVSVSVFYNQDAATGGFTKTQAMIDNIRSLLSRYQGTVDGTIIKNSFLEDESIEMMDEGVDGEKYIMGSLRFKIYIS